MLQAQMQTRRSIPGTAIIGAAKRDLDRRLAALNPGWGTELAAVVNPDGDAVLSDEAVVSFRAQQERLAPARQARAHVAKSAGARAGFAHDHEGRVALVPAFADVGAARFLADG